MHGRCAALASAIAVSIAAPAAAFAPGTTTLLDRAGSGPLVASPFTDQPGRLTAATTPDGRYTAFVSGADGLSASDDNRSIGIWRRDHDTDTTLLVTEIGSSGGFDSIGISDDGNRVAFLSSTPHVGADTDLMSDVYVRDISAGTLVLASPGGGDDLMFNPAISGGGTHVVFTTFGSLLPADTGSLSDVYRYEIATGTLELVSRADGVAGTIGNGHSSLPDINGDGDVVAFHSTATNLDGGDSNAVADVFRRRMSTGITDAVSTIGGSGGTEGNGSSSGASISADGDEIAFASQASNLAAGDTGDVDVFRKKVSTDATILASRADGASGAKFPTEDGSAQISPDGSSVAWSTASFPAPSEVHVRRGLDGGDPQTDLVSRSPGPGGVTADGSSLPYGVTDGGEVTWVSTARNLPQSGDVDFEHGFLTDVVAGTMEPFMRPTGPATDPFPAPENAADLEDWGRTVSDDGRYVAFTSGADGLSPDDDNRVVNAFVRDTLTGTTTLVSRAGGAAGAGANAFALHAVISGDGRRVAWETTATNLGGPAVSGKATHVFVRDLDTHETLLATRADGAAGAPSSAGGVNPALDRDGSRIAFQTSSATLGNGDADAVFDIHVRDTEAGRTILASRADGAGGAKGAAHSEDPFLDASGTRVTFRSAAANLGDGDTDGSTDIHVRDLGAGRTVWASRPDGTGSAQTDGFNGDPSISADGSRVAFRSTSSNLGDGDTDDLNDIHVRDLTRNETTLVSRATGPGGAKSGVSAGDSAISSSGTAVTFSSFSENLVPTDVNGVPDIFVRRLDTNTTTLVSRGNGANGPFVSPPGPGRSASTDAPGINGDGSCVAFQAFGAPELLPPGASPDFTHLFLRVLGRECPLPPIQTTIDDAAADGKAVTLTFSSNAPGATFLCRVDGGPFAPCASGVRFEDLAVGAHTFEVKAVDPATFEDPTPASRSATVAAPPAGGDTKGTGEAPASPAPVAVQPPPVVVPPRPAAPAPPALTATQVLRLPSACTSRRRFRIGLRLPAGVRVRGVAVTVNGKRAKSSRKGANVDLRGLPKGRIAVKITVTLADGRSVTTTKRYRTCTPRKRRG